MSTEKNQVMEIKKILPIILVYAVALVLAVVANIISPGFLALNHIDSIFRQMAFLGIVCIGQTLVILTAGIDLSVRYTLVLCNVISAQLINGSNGKTLTALLVSLAVSALIGLLNGLGICYLKIPAMIMTLAMGSAVWGVAYIYCNGSPKGKTSEVLSQIANGKLGGIINGVTLIWIILAAVVIIFMKYSIFGRAVYAVGVNPVNATYSGFRTNMVLIGVYVISAVLAGMTGFLFLGYTGTSYLSTAESFNMDSIAAVVVGGTSVLGGSGSYVGTIAGVAIMTLISSLMTVLNMAESGKQMVQGLLLVVLLVAVYGRSNRVRA